MKIDSTLNKVSGMKKEITRLLEERERLFEQYEKGANSFSVVVIGQQNNGKSTLCNMLCKDWSNHKFPVADRRLTETTQEELDLNSGILYIDTPGFSSANTEDDRIAQEQWTRANLIILVHSVRTGELDNDEIRELKKLQSRFPDLENRLFVACSKIGEEDQSRVNEVLEAVQARLMDLHISVPVEAIDSIDYKEGKLAEDEDLIEASNVSVIHDWINDNKDIGNMILISIKENSEKLLSLLEKIADEMIELSTEKIQYMENLSTCWDKNKKRIKYSWDKCASYK